MLETVLITDNMIAYIETPKESTTKITIDKIQQRHKIQIQCPKIVYVQQKKMEKNVKAIPLTMTSKT